MWRLPIKTSIGFFGAFALLVLVGGIGYVSLLRYFESRAAQARSRQNLIELARLEKSIVDAETGQRGYLLTSDDAYLAPYESARVTVPRGLKTVEDYFRGNAEQTARIVELRAAAEQKLAELAETIRLRREKTTEAALVVVRGGSGKRFMDAARGRIAEIRDVEEAGLAAATIADARRASLSSTLGIVGNLLALAIILVAIYFINHEFMRRDKLERKLADSNSDLEAFAYSVAHDLKAPLRAITGFSQAVVEDYHDKIDDDGKRYLDSIRSNARRMGQLIEDLLAYSRLGRIEMAPVLFDIGELFHSALEELTQGDPQRMAPVRIAPNMPHVLADKTMLKQATVNLLSNALKFSSSQAAPQIDVAFRDDGGRYVFQVKDNGVGFDMQYADNLFGVFQRLHRREDFEGTGVGLAIVRRAVRRNGGDVWAESKPGEGARFSFTLPKTEVRA